MIDKILRSLFLIIILPMYVIIVGMLIYIMALMVIILFSSIIIDADIGKKIVDFVNQYHYLAFFIWIKVALYGTWITLIYRTIKNRRLKNVKKSE